MILNFAGKFLVDMVSQGNMLRPFPKRETNLNCKEVFMFLNKMLSEEYNTEQKSKQNTGHL